MDSITTGQVMPPQVSARFGEIELLRAIAVLIVLVEHLRYNLLFWNMRVLPWLSGFWTGVDLFFVISGFVIARTLLPRLATVATPLAFMRVALEFWLRRAWRLLPSAWLWLVLPLLLCVAYNRSGAFQTLQANWEMCIAGLLYLANFRTAMIYGMHDSGTAFVQWSLSLEEQFYFILPFAAYFFRRQLVYPVAVVAALGFFVDNSALSFQVRLWPVAFGVLLAIWSTSATYRLAAPTGLAHFRWARAATLLVLLVCLVNVGLPTLSIVKFYQGPVAVISAVLVWIASYDSGYLCRPGPARRVMEAIGARSYSIYLVHIPVYFAAHESWYRLHGAVVPDRGQTAVYVALAMLAVAAVAELNHRLLEMPLRERGRRLAAGWAKRSS